MKGNRGTFSSTPKEGRVWNASRTIRDSRSDHFRLEKLQVQGWKSMQVPFVNSNLRRKNNFYKPNSNVNRGLERTVFKNESEEEGVESTT